MHVCVRGVHTHFYTEVKNDSGAPPELSWRGGHGRRPRGGGGRVPERSGECGGKSETGFGSGL